MWSRAMWRGQFSASPRAQPIEAHDGGGKSNGQDTRLVIVEPKRARTTRFGPVPEMTPEEHRRRADAAAALFL